MVSRYANLSYNFDCYKINSKMVHRHPIVDLIYTLNFEQVPLIDKENACGIYRLNLGYELIREMPCVFHTEFFEEELKFVL